MYVLSQADKVRKMNECSYQKLQKKNKNKTKQNAQPSKDKLLTMTHNPLFSFPSPLCSFSWISTIRAWLISLTCIAIPAEGLASLRHRVATSTITHHAAHGTIVVFIAGIVTSARF